MRGSICVSPASDRPARGRGDRRLRPAADGRTRGRHGGRVSRAGSDRIFGFTMLGLDAGEVIAVLQMAMLAGLPYTRLRDAIFKYPTMAEGLSVSATVVSN